MEVPAAAELEGALDDLVHAGVPGAVLYIRRPDGQTFLAASGEEDLAGGTSFNASAQFNIASVTKTYIAALVL